MKNEWSDYCDIWNLDSEHCNNLIFSGMMSFNFGDDGEMIKEEKEETSKEFKPGQMAFGVDVEIPELSKIFHLSIKYDDKVKVYTYCKFNNRNFMDSYPDNAIMKNIQRAEKNEVSMSFEGELEYTPEEYRNIFIDKIIDA